MHTPSSASSSAIPLSPLTICLALPVALLLCWAGTPLHAQDLSQAVSLSVQIDGLSASGTIAGFDNDATLGYDDCLDLPEPPDPIDSYITLAFLPMEGAPAWFTRFRTDWRPSSIDLTETTQQWPIQIRSDQTGTISFSAAIGSSVNASIPVYLIDSGQYWNLREDSDYPFSYTSGSSHSITLVIGTPGSATISFLNPSGSPVFTSGTTEIITWEVDGEVGLNQTLAEVSLDGGDSFTLLLESDEPAGSVEWEVPYQTTEEGLFRVTVTDHLERDESAEAGFIVVDETDYLTGVTITTPTANQGVPGGSTVPVTWSYQGGTDNLSGASVSWRIGEGEPVEIATISGTGSSANWQVPGGIFTSHVTLHVATTVNYGTAYESFVYPVSIRPDELLNDNFEIWVENAPEVGPPDNWDTSGGTYGTSYRVVSNHEQVVDGTYCAEINAITPGTYNLYQEIGGISEGLHYRFRCRLYDNAQGVSGYVKLELLAEDGTVLLSAQSDPSEDSNDSAIHEAEADAPEGTVAARFTIHLDATTSGSIYADYAQLFISSPAPAIAFTSPAGGEVHTHDGSSTFSITWSYGGTAQFVESATLAVSLDAGETWSDLSSFTDGTTTGFDWTGSAAYSTDVRFRLTATNNEEASNSELSPSIGLRPDALTDSFSGGWHLFTLPMTPPDPRVSEAIGGDLPGTPALYDYHPGDGYSLSDSLFHGHGYWLALSDDATLTVAGEAEMVSHERELSAGWSLIGAGYPVEYPVASLQLTDGNVTLTFDDAVDEGWVGSELYGFDNSTGLYQARTGESELEPFEGAWLAVLQESLSLVVTAPAPSPFGFTPGGGLPGELDEEDLIAPVLVMTSDSQVGWVGVGFSDAASEGYDPRLDLPAPPAQPQSVLPRLVLRQPGLLPTGPNWRQDVRPFPTEDELVDFDLQVDGVIPEGTSLDFSELVDLLGNRFVAKILLEGDDIVLQEQPIIPMPAGTNSAMTLQISLNDLRIPSDPAAHPTTFGLTDLYPNPFNSSQTVRFALPRRTDLTLQLFDIRGRLVLEERHPAVGPGYLTHTWQATHLATGLYFLHAATGEGGKAVAKVVYIK